MKLCMLEVLSKVTLHFDVFRLSEKSPIDRSDNNAFLLRCCCIYSCPLSDLSELKYSFIPNADILLFRALKFLLPTLRLSFWLVCFTPLMPSYIIYDFGPPSYIVRSFMLKYLRGNHLFACKNTNYPESSYHGVGFYVSLSDFSMSIFTIG